MAFKTNDSQQYSLTDSMNNLTSRELKALEKSWAKVFCRRDLHGNCRPDQSDFGRYG